ncbi:MAG: hypothetical protein ACTIDN_06320 [Acetobacter sp.]|uniref:hypothetical protein n=1 Tax=Acetobacter sp. TaxID=440 RepID=UPI003F8F5C93
MQSSTQFEQNRAQLEQAVHNTVTDPALRNAMLLNIAGMAAAMQTEIRMVDAALRTHHARNRARGLAGWILNVRECAA